MTHRVSYENTDSLSSYAKSREKYTGAITWPVLAHEVDFSPLKAPAC